MGQEDNNKKINHKQLLFLIIASMFAKVVLRVDNLLFKSLSMRAAHRPAQMKSLPSTVVPQLEQGDALKEVIELVQELFSTKPLKFRSAIAATSKHSQVKTIT